MLHTIFLLHALEEDVLLLTLPSLRYDFCKYTNINNRDDSEDNDEFNVDMVVTIMINEECPRLSTYTKPSRFSLITIIRTCSINQNKM